MMRENCKFFGVAGDLGPPAVPGERTEDNDVCQR